jgi:Ca2+-binding RTX toxin-like protein/exonuclease III
MPVDSRSTDAALQVAWSSLSQMALDENLFALAFGTAFGSLSSSRSWSEKQRMWANGQFGDFPDVEVLPAARLMGVQAVFAKSTNKIYISEEFIHGNQNNTAIIAAVLLREYGHYLDWKFRSYDNAGNEGIFSRLARHQQPTSAEIIQLNTARMLLDKAGSESKRTNINKANVVDPDVGADGLAKRRSHQPIFHAVEATKIGLEIHASHGWTDSNVVDAAAGTLNENDIQLGEDGRGNPKVSGSIANPLHNLEVNRKETRPADKTAFNVADTLQNNTGMSLLDINRIAFQALRDGYEYLNTFRFDPEYSQKLVTAFGNDFNRLVADDLFNNFSDGNFSALPAIRIVNRADIYGGNAAFSADTGFVYLTVEFLSENQNNKPKVTNILLEEIGHFIDSKINKTDSPGDEGEIFANLVQGNLLSEQELQALRSENDLATVISSNQGITVISGQSAIEIEQNVKALRVATWNIWNETGSPANNTIEGIKRRINYIARFGSATDIDVIALQEIKNPKTDPLADALRAYRNNDALPDGYTRDGLKKMLEGYDFIVATSENNPSFTQNNTNTTDGYLILFDPNTVSIENVGFFSATTFIGTVDGNTYGIRPPYEVNIRYNQTKKAYKILTWHNEYEGGALGAQARFTGMQRLSEGLKELQADSPTIVLGDFNVRPNEINLFSQGYDAAHSPEYDYILAHHSSARIEKFGLTLNNFPELTSDAHTALFAEIDGREAKITKVGLTQIKIIVNLEPDINETNRSKYEYNTTSISATWIDQKIQIGKTGNFFIPQTTVDGGKVTVREETVNGKTKKYIDVKANPSNINAKIYSAIGNNQTTPLFNGEMAFDTDNLKGSIIDRGDSGDPSAFRLIGGIEVSFNGLSFSEDAQGSPQLRLQGSMLLPKNLVGGNGLEVAINGNDYLGISDNGLEVTGGFVKLPGKTTFVALGLLEIKALDAQVKFDFTKDEITLQGKFSIPSLNNATFDLQDGNYIKVKKIESGLAFSMVASASVANIPLLGSWEIQDIKLNVDSTKNNFAINARLKTPGSSIALVLGFENGRLKTVTGSSEVGTDFSFLGAAIDIRSVTAIVDRNAKDNESWDPEFSLQGEIVIPTLKGLKGTLSGSNKFVVNKDKAFLTGAQLSADDINLGKWKLKNIQAFYQANTNLFTGSAKLQTYANQDINVSLAFDQNGLKNITATNVTFGLFGANVIGASINFTPDRKPTEGDTWDPEFKIQGKIVLPNNLAEIIVNENDYLLVNNDGLVLSGLQIYKENLNLNLSGLRINGKRISLKLNTVNNETIFLLQGEIILPDINNLTGIFSGSNYIKVTSSGAIEVVGSISASNILIAPGWKIKVAVVTFNTVENQIFANATIEIPSGIEVGAAILWKNNQLQFVSIEAADLNKPIGTTGAFLQNLKGSYGKEVVYNNKTYKDAFSGSAKITAGPKIDLNLPDFLGGRINDSLIRLDLEALITEDLLNAKGSIRVLGNLITGQGEVNLNWKVNSFLATANLNILYGLIVADATLIARAREGTKLDFFAFATGSVNIPTPIPVIGGFTLGSGGVYFQYIDDGQSYNDYVAAWGQLLGWTIGLKIGFDGSVGLIGSELPALAKTHIEKLRKDINNPYLMAPLSLPSKGSNNNDLINGNEQPELLEGVGGNDIINGKGGDDILEGGDGNDILNGGAGKNAYTGGTGNDILIGGTGDDIYIFDTDSAQGFDTVNELIIAIKFARDTFWWNGGWKVGYAQATKTFWNIQQQDSNDGITDETKFTVVNNGDGTVSLKTIYDRFWRADEVSNITSSEYLDSWEKFTIITNNDGTTSLKSFHNTYIRANTTSITDARWNIDQSTELNAWEKFMVEDQNNNSKDTLDFSATTTKSINLNLSLAGLQRINENLSLTLGITIGSRTFINIENAIGGSLSDTLVGNYLGNRLQGNGGNDTLDGGDGTDESLYSGTFDQYTVVRDGSDFLVYDNRDGAPDGVDRVRNVERLIFAGGVSFQPNANNTGTIQAGSASSDMLIGSAFGDQLSGGDGKDTLVGGAGNDILRGGSDWDIVDYSNAHSGVDVSLGNGSMINNDGFGNRDILWEIENLAGSNYNDTLSGYDVTNVIYGLGGDDKIFGYGGNDTLYGDLGNGNTTSGKVQYVKVASWNAANADTYQDIKVAGRFLSLDYDSILSHSTTGFLIGTVANKSQVTVNDPEFDRRQVKVMAGDFDGDGWDDLFRLEYADWCDSYRDAEIYLNRPNGTGGRSFVKSIDLSSALWIRGDLTNIIIGDFNGDKKADFLRQEKGWWDDDNTSTIIAFLNTSTTSAATTNISFNSFDQKLEELKGDISKLVVGDFNGDGKDDFIRQGIGSNGNDAAKIYSLGWLNTFSSNIYQGIIPGISLNGDFTEIIVGDFNSDGIDDFIRQEKGWWAAIDDIGTAELFINRTNMVWDINWKFDNAGMLIPVSEKLSVENGKFIAGNFYGNNQTDLFLNGFFNNTQSARSDLFLSTDIPPGNDTLSGGEGNDWLDGGAANDYLLGGSGDDTLYGGDGNDSLSGGNGNDRLFGDNGNDIINGDDGDDVLQGNAGNDSLFGGAGSDLAWYSGATSNYRLQYKELGKYQLTSTTASDASTTGDSLESVEVIQFGASNTKISLYSTDQEWFSVYGYLAANEDVRNTYGVDLESASTHYLNNATRTWKKGTERSFNFTASANDSKANIFGTIFGEHIFGGSSDDSLSGQNGDDYIFGAAGRDRIDGGTGNDYLYGDDGSDTLIGGDGNDNLFGGAGDDFLIGGSGNNSIDGGNGFDTADFGQVNPSNLTISRINGNASTTVTAFKVSNNNIGSSSIVGLSVDRIAWFSGDWWGTTQPRPNKFLQTSSLQNWFNADANRASISFAAAQLL